MNTRDALSKATCGAGMVGEGDTDVNLCVVSTGVGPKLFIRSKSSEVYNRKRMGPRT